MARMISILFILLMASPTWAFPPVMMGKAAAAAAASSACVDATHDSGNNAIVLCEDFDGSSQCTAGYTSNCRGAWLIAAGTPDYDYGTSIEGTYSLYLDASSAAVTMYKSFTSATDMHAFMMVKPASISASNRTLFTFTETTTGRLTVTLNAAGTLKVAHGTVTATTVSAMSAGTVYYVWAGYTKGTGGDGAAYVAFSSTTTKPGVGNNYASVTTGDATTNVDRIYLQAGTVSQIIFDHIRLNSSTFGSNPP